MPDMHVIERRIYATEFREVSGSNGRQRWARATTYDTVDDYGTIWLPGCWNDGLDERMPTILYGHDWWTLEHVLGQGVDYRDVRAADDFGPPGCDVLIEFADPEQVPSARLAMALTTPSAQRQPVLKDVSVGFDRQEWLRKDELSTEQLASGAEEAMQRAIMDELSIVVRGAVPGAQMRSRRSFVIDGEVVEAKPDAVDEPPVRAAEGVSIDDVITVARRRAAGEVSLDEARAALELLDGHSTTAPPAAAGAGDGLEPNDQAMLRAHVGRLEERMVGLFTSDQRQLLRDALNDRFQPGPDRYVWVVDFDDEQVIFELSGFDDSGMFMLAYTIDGDGVVTLDAGVAIEVSPHTTYVPEPGGSDTGGGAAAAPPSEPRVSDDAARAALAMARRGR